MSYEQRKGESDAAWLNRLGVHEPNTGGEDFMYLYRVARAENAMTASEKKLLAFLWERFDPGIAERTRREAGK